MKKIFIICLGTFYCLSVYALGGWTSGGGYAAKRGNTYYLYDFVEGQLYDNIYINHTQTDQMQINKRLRSVIMPLGEEAVNLTIKKINEIYILLPELAEMLVKTIETYQWRTTEWQILAANDLGNTYGNPTSGNNIEKIPMVFRDDSKRVAWIVKDIWQKLSINQKLGTIFHEAIYALMAKKLSNNTSENARELNIYIFSPTFEYQSVEQVVTKLATLGWHKMWLSLEEYQYFNSDHFANECREFNEQIKVFISNAVTEYQKLYEKQKTIMWNISSSSNFNGWYNGLFPWCDVRAFPWEVCSDRDDVEYLAPQMYIDNVLYYYPPNNKMIYQHVAYQESGNRKSLLRDKIIFKDSELKNIKNYIYQANVYQNKLNDENFSEQCDLKNHYDLNRDVNDFVLIQNFAELKILN